MVDGTVYELNGVGEFVLALSSQSGDTFQVQARLQAYPGSDSASVITQLAFQVGTDRITIGTDRTNPVWVNGAEVALTLGQSFSLSGGQITQTSATSYRKRPVSAACLLGSGRGTLPRLVRA